MKVTFLGDSHGRWDHLYYQMGLNSNTEAFVSVGDFGVLPGLNSFPPEEGFDRPLYFVDGNHEDHDLLATHVAKKNLEIVPNLFYAPRGTQKTFGNTAINFCGGAESVDKRDKLAGRDWFSSEIPSQADMDRFINLPPADIWVTHNAPKFITEPISHFKVKDPTNWMLEVAWHETKHQPDIWFFGHYHKHVDKTVGKTRFICLPCVHPHYFYDSHGYKCKIGSFKGMTLDL